MKINKKISGFLKELNLLGMLLVCFGIVLLITQPHTEAPYYVACIVVGGLMMLTALVDLILKKKVIKTDGGVNLTPINSRDLEKRISTIIMNSEKEEKMKKITNWLGKVENLSLVAGSLIFITAMLYFIKLREDVGNAIPMISYLIASGIFFYLAIYYARQSDKTLQEQKFSWRRFTFGLVILLAACTAYLLYNGTLGKAADIFVQTVCVVSPTFGVIVIVSALKRIHLPN